MRQRRGRLFLVLVVCLFGALSAAWSGDLLQAQIDGGQFRSVSTDLLTKVPVTLCHIPPDNPANAHTIVVDQAAVAAHLAHGDSFGECPQACAAVPSAVQKTGQTTCWDDAGNPIDCAGTGQDGEFQKGVSVDPRFTDNGDGTVKDNLTGLIWLKNANCFGIRSWTDALTMSNTLSAGNCGLTDGSAAGAWRLPNVNELQSLIDFGQYDPALPVGYPFAGVQDFYWSSTSYAGFPESAWFVYLPFGYFEIIQKISAIYVWPVRGGQ